MSNHHADSSPSPASLPLLGVPPTFFETFIEQCGGPSVLTNLTTAEVCERFVKPHTLPTQSLCELLLSFPNPYSTEITNANWFISHSWSYKFLDVAEAITSYFSKQSATSSAIVWFDLFSLPQHNRQTMTSEWLQTTFKSAIASMKNVLMIWTPWNAPITLTRAWCVFEVYACADTDSNFDIAFPPSEITKLKAALRNTAFACTDAIASIKSVNSIATHPDDLNAIHKAIRSSITFTNLDQMIFKVLFPGVVSSLKVELRLAEEKGDAAELALWQSILASLYGSRGMYKEGLGLREKAAENSKRAFGEDHIETLDALSALGDGYATVGKYDVAESIARKVLEKREQLLGKHHRATFSAALELASVYSSSTKYQAAEESYTRIMREVAEVFGPDDYMVSTCKGALASLYHTQRQYYRYNQVEAFRKDVYESSKKQYGEGHADTIGAANNLATIYFEMGKHQKALFLLEDSVQELRRIHGDDNPRTIAVVCNLALMFMRLEEYKTAEFLFLDCVERGRKAGENGTTTLFTSLHNLGSLYIRQKRYWKAAAVREECLRGMLAVNGGDHPNAAAYRAEIELIRQQAGCSIL
ncbi:Kinesin light chain 3 [Rhizophlyctis rosea]|nr:Kinesin light chain 3 [Rhizophlyctis rosea]